MTRVTRTTENGLQSHAAYVHLQYRECEKWAAVLCSLSRRLCVLEDLGPAALLLRSEEEVVALTLCCCVPTLSTSPASRLPCA